MADSSRLWKRGQPGTQPWSSQRNKRTEPLPQAPHPRQGVRGRTRVSLATPRAPSPDTKPSGHRWVGPLPFLGEPPQLCSQPKPPPGGSHCHWEGLTAPGHQAPLPPGSASLPLPRVSSLAAPLRGSHSEISRISHTSLYFRSLAMGHLSAPAPNCEGLTMARLVSGVQEVLRTWWFPSLLPL